MGVIGQPILFGGGGIGFEVLGGTTEPTTTKDFAIWVNTPYEIQDCKFAYRVPSELEGGYGGDVWFQLGVTSENYHLSTVREVMYSDAETDIIPISPLSCLVYSDETWKWEGRPFKLWDKEAGAWVDPGPWFLYTGDKSSEAIPYNVGNDLPGGLQLGYYLNQGNTNTSNNYRMMSDRIQWAVAKSPGNSFNIEPAVDLTGFKYICFDIQCADRNSDQSKVTVGVGTNKMTDFSIPGAFAASVGSIWNTKRTVYRVDISALSGPHYAKLAGYNTTGYLFNCWLER